MGWFLVGLAIGVTFGVLAVALCVAGAQESPTMHDENGLR
jgi:hypothetical protein